MSTTYTGRLLTPVNFGVPAPLDIAVQLGRIPRFSGATRMWPWSVLHHTWACLLYAERIGLNREVRSVVALHDAEEVATGDVPTPWKNDALRSAQARLSERIFRIYTPELTGDRMELAVRECKEIDYLFCVAEMHVVGPPGVLLCSGLDVCGVEHRTLKFACDIVQEVGTTFCDAHDSQHQSGKLVDAYLTTLRDLLGWTAELCNDEQKYTHRPPYVSHA